MELTADEFQFARTFSETSSEILVAEPLHNAIAEH
jgi:hypothetical protein